jgi:hypothetical protein
VLPQGLRMYREAAKQINKGLSLGARVVIGVAALLTALVMLVPNTPPQNPVLAYSVAGFCLAIAVACFVRGRLRQFAGSCKASGFLQSLCITSHQSCRRAK